MQPAPGSTRPRCSGPRRGGCHVRPLRPPRQDQDPVCRSLLLGRQAYRSGHCLALRGGGRRSTFSDGAPRTEARCRGVNQPGFFAFSICVAVPLLRDREMLLVEPVEHQARREEEEHTPKISGWFEHHHRLGLHRVQAASGRGLYWMPHRGHHQHQQDEPRVHMVGGPAPRRPSGVAHYDAGQQHPVKRNRTPDLHQDRQAAAEQMIFSFL